MSDFQKLNINVHYDTDCNDIVKEFYNVIIPHSVTYKRAVAFFTSSSLIEIIDGLKTLVKRNGKIFLLISPQLEENDIDAIEMGYQTREKLLEEKIIREFEITKTKYSDKYNLLAWLIYKNVLDIKIVYRVDHINGIFHDKLGILYDSKGNKISFHGSNNETFKAMNSNYEAFDVYVSWDERDLQRIKIKEEQFDRLWNNRSNVWKSFHISSRIIEMLLSYKHGDDPFSTEVGDHDNLNKIDKNPYLPRWLNLREYQLKAINEWFKNEGKGIFEMATGERVIIVTGCINALRSRVSGTLVNMIHALLRVIKYNYCKQCMRSKDVLALQY